MTRMRHDTRLQHACTRTHPTRTHHAQPVLALSTRTRARKLSEHSTRSHGPCSAPAAQSRSTCSLRPMLARPTRVRDTSVRPMLARRTRARLTRARSTLARLTLAGRLPRGWMSEDERHGRRPRGRWTRRRPPQQKRPRTTRRGLEDNCARWWSPRRPSRGDGHGEQLAHLRHGAVPRTSA